MLIILHKNKQNKQTKQQMLGNLCYLAMQEYLSVCGNLPNQYPHVLLTWRRSRIMPLVMSCCLGSTSGVLGLGVITKGHSVPVQQE